MAPSINIGIEAFNAFLQANVTGPILTDHQAKLATPYEEGNNAINLGLRSLDVDGVSIYPFIPHIELFCLARHVIENATPGEWESVKDGVGGGVSLAWMKLRLHVWHYKLFIQPSLSSGSVFTKHVGMSEVPSLVEKIQSSLQQVEGDVLGEAWEVSETSSYSTEVKVRFMVEKANICIMLGQDVKAREALETAAELHGFVYALSGALGKRTRFQEKSTSQLVVLAKSAVAQQARSEKGGEEELPEALPLNDDTLLEEIEFSKDGAEGKHGEQNGPTAGTVSELPAELTGLKPDEQPQLSPLDQIILLTEATLKDAFSPADTLTPEEILPFAVRVVNDKSTNWQIYTQALLVRSRIEVHRSRTVERGVLQMQAVVDQVIADTTPNAKEDETTTANDTPEAEQADVPTISVSAADEDATPRPRRDREAAAPVSETPGSFFPAAKPSESAPAHVRLEYIHALSSPPRWHLESELAYAWTGVGSLVSALEIFKRLKLWAEVALCLASSAAQDDQDGSGRGSGGEEKARAIIRWRLFHRKDRPDDEIDEDTDISTLKAAEFTGPERMPAQPNAPRLFCILGDLEPESAVAYFEKAWEISNHRYARAQKSLGEHYLAGRDWHKAREAYKLAVSVNRIAPDLWNRLGDINLRLGDFGDAAEAFTRAISSSNDSDGGEDARTWSNLGSALYSLYLEALGEINSNDQTIGDENKDENKNAENGHKAEDDEEDDDDTQVAAVKTKKDPSMLLAQSMNAYKRGASIAGDNWRIWDNVITLATRMRPIPFFEVIQALRSVIRIKNSESSLDADILRLLLTEGVLSPEKKKDTGAGVYEPPRGSVERNINDMMERDIVPLITNRSELWELVCRLRTWRRDYAGAVDASEKAWRTAIGGATSGAGSMGGGLTVDSAKRDNGDGPAKNGSWLEDEDAWLVVVQRTDELVALMENYGPEVPEVGDKWKGKARSAIRSVMGKGKESWEGSEGWETLKALLEGLKA
ncbi:hypothetical protein VM1G_10961 [Cytospora mali]|uniref:Uncharacterized protein n=1 Tax=Cytospora mali TaxID=578113 RepID=A0A194VJZ0_CYTMA|nr:hypothetical protein VM1G_10961 [Valsa mali]